MYAKYKQAALEWVNQIRSEIGLPTLAELPHGEPCTGRRCPIARALTGRLDGEELTSYVGQSWFEIGERGVTANIRRGKLGPWVHEFIHAFDHGAYPELRV